VPQSLKDVRALHRDTEYFQIVKDADHAGECAPHVKVLCEIRLVEYDILRHKVRKLYTQSYYIIGKNMLGHTVGDVVDVTLSPQISRQFFDIAH
jgi:hypothetical protein